MKKLFAWLSLIVCMLVIYSIYNYNYSNVSFDKNQKTLVNFFAKNHWQILGEVDLSANYFHDWFMSDYQLKFDVNFYNLNLETVAFVNVSFDHLKFEYLKLLVFYDQSNFYWRVVENTLEAANQFSVLNSQGWQAINLVDLQTNLDINVLSFLGIDNKSGLILRWSSIAEGFFADMNWVVPELSLEFVSDDRAVLANNDFLDLEVKVHDFGGQLPISKPLNFRVFK